MKKSILKFFIVTTAAFLLMSCENFFDGDELKTSISEKINFEKSEVVTLRFQEAQSGTIYPSGDKDFHVGETVTVEFTYDPKFYAFDDFIVVNKEDSKQIKWNENEKPAIEIIEYENETSGVYKKVSALVKINGSVKNAQISPSLSELNDKTPPFLTSKEFIVKNPFNDAVLPDSAVWSNDDYYNYHVKNSVYVNFTAADTGSGKLRLKVVEKPVTNADGTPAAEPAFTNFDDTVAVKSGSALFEADGEYKIHTVFDGIIQLQFSLTDMMSNETEVLETVYVLTDNTVADDLKNFLTVVPAGGLDYLVCETEEQILEQGTRIYVDELKPAETEFYEGKKESLSYEYFISTNNVDWNKVTLEETLYKEILPPNEERIRNYINIEGMSRASDIYVKIVASDSVGNVKDKIFTVNKIGKLMYAMNMEEFLLPIAQGDGNGGFIWIWFEENEKELHFISEFSSDYELPINIPDKKYSCYFVYYNNDLQISLLSEKLVLSSDFVLPLFNTDKNLNLGYTLESKGINTGLYTLKIKAENFEELGGKHFITSEGEFFKYNDRSENDEIVFDNVPYEEIVSGILITGIVWNEEKSHANEITIDDSYPGFVPNVEPDVRCGTSGYGEILIFSTSDAGTMTDYKLYYSDKIIERTEEEIQQLDVFEVYGTRNGGREVSYNINKLGQGNYIFYFYALDSYGNYTYKKVILDKSYKEEIMDFVPSDTNFYIEIPSSFADYDMLLQGYYTTSLGSVYSQKLVQVPDRPYVKNFGYYRPVFYRTVDDTFELVYRKPFCKYGGEEATLVKRISEAAGIVTIISDMPCLVETIATDDDYTNWTIDDWLMRTPMANKSNLKRLGSNGGSSHVVSFSNYTIVPPASYKAYCVIVHFADGTAQMSVVHEN